ncbi:MAG: hypothetical protein WC481_08925, partial [Candidatus Omnitrophota bacterium]
MARKVSFACTVNLDRYENFRMEVTDDGIETEADIDALIADFDRALARFGRKDEKARAAIDSYRERILGTVIEAARPETLPPHPGTIPRTSDL